ncbi:MAG TPA: hypothetical protein VKH13_02380 [Steroidobacteraceae bacterium]|nr:hypothetical protein [Steroidobacteraceae bacterium]
MHPPDDLEDYLRGDSALSRQYRRESAPLPPHALDRRVLKLFSKEVHGKPPWLAPLAFAASVLLSVALVLAIVFGPPNLKRDDDAPRLMRVAAHSGVLPSAAAGRKLLYSSDPPRTHTPPAWLADIAALRRAGRDREADAEFARFRSAYPDYTSGESPIRP